MYGIVVHGGAGGTSTTAERGCNRAVSVGLEVFRRAEPPVEVALETAIAAVKYMEDSGIFNAGVGSILRLDGVSIECDAVVATHSDGSGRQGAVGAVRDVKNPVLLARAVRDSPHVMLTGEGATAFARRLGLESHPGPTARVRRRYESMRRAVERGQLEAIAPGWTSEDLERFWGIEGFIESPTVHCGTVGAVSFDQSGFALASSTGGSGLMALGRVGDVPLRGAGWEIGRLGGVLATGIGEEIIRRQGSRRVYQFLELGLSAQQACEQGIALFPPDVPVGFIALTREGVGIGSNYPMPSYAAFEQNV